MRKFLFFHLWKLEKLEEYLEIMEKNGYRLDFVKHSYWFSFKESNSKEMHYFLSYKSFVKPSMGMVDYALLSRHNANIVKTKMCFFEMYRTKENKEKLKLLYEVRMDYIRLKLLENALTSLFCMALFVGPFLASITTQPTNNDGCIAIPFIVICGCFAVYYFFGYLKQRRKCKKYERSLMN